MTDKNTDITATSQAPVLEAEDLSSTSLVAATHKVQNPKRRTETLVPRHFTEIGYPAETTDLEWSLRDAKIHGESGATFIQENSEFPTSWSDNAVAIVSSKYMRGKLGGQNRETSLKQIVNRVTDTICSWGLEDGYFANEEEADTFAEELRWILYHQRASFNSPVWFNIGVPNTPQQASACFILSIDDKIESILNWYKEEGLIFRNGSGAGINLSTLRAAEEGLSSGGVASGPVSFMRGADASAGAIRSGGKTRRAAKMVLLDDNHPDINAFIQCKVRIEAHRRALIEAGFDMGFESEDAVEQQFQNANHSIRLSDDFMSAAAHGEEWHLYGRGDNQVLKTVSAAGLLEEIAQAAWACGDPGVQFSDTITSWHTIPNAGPITASNPCSEYMSIDDSACNLASINLLSFANTNGSFDIAGFRQTCRVLFIAQDILVDRADYPTKKIGDNARQYRQLGLGYANLGALLMSQGTPYDSDEGRATAGAITSLMGAYAYDTSSDIAARLGPFTGYEKDAASVNTILARHLVEGQALANRQINNKALGTIAGSCAVEAAAIWEVVNRKAASYGVRNSQATLLAPTGTIAFMMDCDTTGIEPDFALVKTKILVGGGQLTIVNQCVPAGLASLGYDEIQIEQITEYVLSHGTVSGVDSPVRQEHLPVFSCATGVNALSPMSHVRMMAACQPFLSGAISKTVNLPAEATAEEVRDMIVASHSMGIKSLAIYRDGSKATQPLSGVVSSPTAKKSSPKEDKTEIVEEVPEKSSAMLSASNATTLTRMKMPRRRTAETTRFVVGGCAGYMTVGLYEDGKPGEVFVTVAKQGSTLAGMLHAFSIGVSHALQRGATVDELAHTYGGMRFQPAGFTDDPDIRQAMSLPDYVTRRLALDYGEESKQQFNQEEPEPAAEIQTADMSYIISTAPICIDCGTLLERSGTCWACRSCGGTSGCS